MTIGRQTAGRSIEAVAARLASNMASVILPDSDPLDEGFLADAREYARRHRGHDAPMWFEDSCEHEHVAEPPEEEMDLPLLGVPRPPPPPPTEWTRPQPCSFLRPGQTFRGRQCVSQGGRPEHWTVTVTLQDYDPARSYVCGTMDACNVPEACSAVRTFFEGDMIDNDRHSFYTADWAACARTDVAHWTRFAAFSALRREVLAHKGRAPSLAAAPVVFMRWKEQFFMAGSEARLTIAGFYYVALCRRSGRVEGWYYDPGSSPGQRLDLEPLAGGEAGHAFAARDVA